MSDEEIKIVYIKGVGLVDVSREMIERVWDEKY